MINRGYAYIENKKIVFGTPFISAYQLINGKRIFYKEQKSYGVIDDFMIKSDTLFTLGKINIAEYSLKTGDLINNKVVKHYLTGGFKRFAEKYIYIKSEDSGFVNLLSSISAYIYVRNYKGDILCLDNDFEITNKIEKDSLWYKYKTDYKFFFNNNKAVLLDENNEETYELSFSTKSYVINNKLYDIKENKLIVFDLYNFLNKN